MGKRFGGDQADRDSRVQVTAGDVAIAKAMVKHGQAEGERDADVADAEVNAGREDC